ncbi:MAG: UDPGP type 1 family protein [Planctomycetaceae bacterium]|nr:UDPGP type 1 family protein [Planctomycetaceae bacterium]
MNIPDSLKQTLDNQQQLHLIQWWDDLDETQQASLIDQLESIEWEELKYLLESVETDNAEDQAARAQKAVPPETLVGLDDPVWSDQNRSDLHERGETLLKHGKVGAIVVAGGQGSRLGFEHAKGLYPIGPISGATLFDFLCGQIAALTKRYQVDIPYYIMTSDATHDEVTRAFQEHNWFGLSPNQVMFFKQGHMPAVHAETGKLLLAEKHSLALSPDGHGGMIAALDREGVLEDMEARGLEVVYYHQVDNPCVKICDPEFLGLHRQTDSEMSTKVVRKVAPEEKMGLLVDIDGKTQIIEYSDFPSDMAEQTTDDDQLRFWAGNTACHAFSLDFLKSLAESSTALPFHKAHKKVPHLDESGTPQSPESPNAFKFEKFIFDALPNADVALVVETSREREFNPVKNAEGSDSPATCQAALQSIWRSWLSAAGIDVDSDVTVEIQPSFAIDEAGVVEQKDQISEPVDGELLLK